MGTIPGGRVDVVVVGTGPTAWCASIAVARSGVRTVLAVPGSRPLIEAPPAEDPQAIAVLRSWGVSAPAGSRRWGQSLVVTTLGLTCCEVWSGALPTGRAHDAPAVQGPTVVTLTDASSHEWRVATRVLIDTGPDAGRGSLDEAVLHGAALAGTARSLLAGSATDRGAVMVAA